MDALKVANGNLNEPQAPKDPCPCCGGRMIIICIPRFRPLEVFGRRPLGA